MARAMPLRCCDASSMDFFTLPGFFTCEYREYFFFLFVTCMRRLSLVSLEMDSFLLGGIKVNRDRLSRSQKVSC